MRLPAVLLCLLPVAVAPRAGAAGELTLTEGTALHASASADGRRIALDLAGRIWILDRKPREARALTAGTQVASRPALSPDGRLVAFEFADRGRRQIAVVPVAGGLPRQVSFGDFDHRAPSWHPDGKRLLLSSDRGGSEDIWALDLTSLDLEQLSFAPGDERDPAWDDAGRRLVYVGDTPDGGDGLYVREPDGRRRLLWRERGRLHAPAWRPGGGLIAYVRRIGGRGQLRLLLLSEPPVSKGLTRHENVFASRPSWQGPDQLIYTADGRLRRRHLDRFAAEDLPFNARVTVPDRAPVSPAPAPAPDWPQPARAFSGLDGGNGRWYAGALGAVWALDRAGQVTRRFGVVTASARRPALAPGLERLAWISDHGGAPRAWVAELDHGPERAIGSPEWRISAIAWRPDGRSLAGLARRAGAARQSVLLLATDGTAAPRLIAGGLRGLSGLSWSGPDRLRLYRDVGLPDLLLGLDGRLGEAAPDGMRQACGPPGGEWLAGLDAGGRLRLPGTGADSPGTVEAFGCTASGGLWYQRDGRLWQWRPGEEARPLRLGLSWRPAEGRGRRVLRVGRLFDGLGPGYVTQRDIVIEDGRIVAIQPWQDPPPPGRLLDLRELTALPGLVDVGAAPGPMGLAVEGRAWLDAGVTSLRYAAADPRGVAERAETWRSGTLPGPRVYYSPPACAAAGSVSAAARLAGYRLCEAADRGWPAQIADAHALGQPAIATRPFPALLLPIDELWLAGQSGVYGDIIDLAGARSLRLASRLTALLPPPPQAPSAIERAQARARAQALFRAAGRGARILPAADGRRWPPGLGLRRELQALVDSGLQPFEVLRMATRDAAQALAAGRGLGELRPGARADLLLVAGDPLADIEAATHPALVLLGGREYRPGR